MLNHNIGDNYLKTQAKNASKYLQNISGEPFRQIGTETTQLMDEARFIEQIGFECHFAKVLSVLFEAQGERAG